MANIRSVVYSDIEFPWSLDEEENVKYILVMIELEQPEIVAE